MSGEPPTDETPLQRALRLKKEKLDARVMPDKGRGRDAPRHPGATAKPWMKK
ncbi:MAG: hypothetical protein K1X35_06545 [Caulobacteraceae bacterium]|nr:hypothetical protein [Caulobacteraceae bacterium]